MAKPGKGHFQSVLKEKSKGTKNKTMPIVLWDLEMMSQRCHHVDNWIKKYESINNYSLESHC